LQLDTRDVGSVVLKARHLHARHQQQTPIARSRIALSVFADRVDERICTAVLVDGWGIDVAATWCCPRRTRQPGLYTASTILPAPRP
jgi:hypothetical protein